MTAKSPLVSAKIYGNIHCGTCGWPIILACCNDAMATTVPYAGNDWWLYCSNKACPHHAGSDLFQTLPDWVLRNSVADKISPDNYVTIPRPQRF